MDFNKTFLLIVSLSCLLLHTHAAAVAAPVVAPSGRRVRSPQAMVMNLCKSTTNRTLCIRTILPAMKGTSSDPYKALEAEMNATRNQVAVTRGLIDTLLAKPNNPKSLADSLSICKDQYGNMPDSIKDAIDVVSKRTVTESKYKFSAVLSYYNTCNDGFGKEVSPIAKEAIVVYQLAGNCLDIIKAIEDREYRRLLRRFGNKLPPPPPAVVVGANDPCFDVIGTCSSI